MPFEFEIKGKRYSIRLKARKALNGDIFITDHPWIDIVLSPENMKVMTFPRVKQMTEDIYDTQMRLLDFMRRKGVIEPDSIQGSNALYGIEATIHQEEDYGHPLQVAIWTISKWLDEEMPMVGSVNDYRKKRRKEIVDPNVDDSTELGEVPHSREKGNRNTYVNSWGGVYRAFQENKTPWGLTLKEFRERISKKDE